MALGLLLEARHARRPAGDDGGLAELLGYELAAVSLSDEDAYAALAGLETYVRSQPVPDSGALWALGKSANPRVVPVLTETLSRFLHEPEHQVVAEQALTSLLPFDELHAREAVRQAAREGQGNVQEDALAFLRVQGLTEK
ncbi:hypothetical protein Dcar01_02964 [Deinococcus carri]|uniref:HEAT repeat domain-containing protein n=1 Tax=Deinococcus carri TaxID=1211323 RepID=A0ABP9WBT0_9DEIO